MRKFISGAPYRRFPRRCGGLDTYAMFTAGGDLLLSYNFILFQISKSVYAALAIVQVMYGSLLMEGDRIRRRIGRG